MSEAAPAPKQPDSVHGWWARLCGGVVPEALGIGNIALIVIGLGLLTATADFALRRQADARQADRGAELAKLVAALAVASADTAEARAALESALASQEILRSVAWLDATGKTRLEWVRVNGAGGFDADQSAPSFHETAVTMRDGQPGGTVTIEINPPGRGAALMVLYAVSAALMFGSLIVYLIFYRRLRRHVHPLSAIQRNLRSYATGVEHDLVALRLSDTLGADADAWNQMIRQLARLQESQAAAGDRPSADATMCRFENRTLRSILDRLPYGVLRLGTDGGIRYANLSATRLLEHGAQELVGAAFSDVIGEKCAQPLLAAHQRGKGPVGVDQQRGEGDDRRTLRLEIVPQSSEAGERDSLLVVQDVTHLLEVEQARDNFLFHVTHELRTPLTNIQAYAETLSRPDFDDERTRKECYNVIVSETNRLSKLIEDMLSISQLEVGSLRMEWGDVDLLRLVRQMVQDNLGGADEKHVDLTLKVPPKVPIIRGDKQRLAVLLNNLIGNAIKYTPERGRVEVRLEVDQRHVRVAIDDTGIGIAERDQQLVFDKFYRAASDEVQQIKGTGLGLAISREVARAHGGDITLDSELGNGSTFTVEFPVNAKITV